MSLLRKWLRANRLPSLISFIAFWPPIAMPSVAVMIPGVKGIFALVEDTERMQSDHLDPPSSLKISMASRTLQSWFNLNSSLFDPRQTGEAMLQYDSGSVDRTISTIDFGLVMLDLTNSVDDAFADQVEPRGGEVAGG